MANESRCERSNTVVTGATQEERAGACAAVADTIDFFARRGLAFDQPLRVTLVARMPATDPAHSVAVYDPARNEIRALDLPGATELCACEPFALWQTMEPAFWRSFIAHETAHAIASAHFAPGVRRFTATEYIAAVATLGTMPRSLRDAIVRRFEDRTPYANLGQVSGLMYLMDPGGFTVRAHRHFEAAENGPAILRLLLEHGAPNDYPR